MGTTTVTTPGAKIKPSGIGARGNGHRDDGRFGGGSGPPSGPGRSGGGDEFHPEKYRIAVWVVVVGVLMLFVSLASAYLFRSAWKPAEGEVDWAPLARPKVLWLNTGVILASSVCLEAARRFLKRERYLAFNRWISITGMLGLAFLAGQFIAWRQFVSQGIYMRSNPHSSYFYLFTGLHAFHLMGGLAAILYVTVRGLRFKFGARQDAAVQAASIYWHFMDGLWVFLFVLLFFWR
jgi:cytochrome c oxidase subunit 3